MNNIYAAIKSQRSQSDLLRSDRKNPVVDHLASLFSLSPEEARLYTLIFASVLEDGICKFEHMKREFMIDDEAHVPLLKSIDRLEKRGLLTIKRDGGRFARTNRLAPVMQIDDVVLNRVIFGIDNFEEIDFSDIYAVTEAVIDLMEKRQEGTLNQSRFFDEFERLMSKLDRKEPFYECFRGFAAEEQMVVFICIMEYLERNSGESAIRIAENIYEKLAHKSQFVSKILKEELKIFKHGIVRLDESPVLFDTTTQVELTEASISMLFGTTVTKLKKFQSRFTRHLEYETLHKSLFLPDDLVRTLQQFENAITPRRFTKVREMLKESHLAAGFVALFYGQPGTGKTASVYELAYRTGRDVLQVDLAAIQSKWVGQSEKNTRAIFDEYRRAKDEMEREPILLFNEADGLLSRRLDVRDSVAQMHNTMQNIILEELENFDGICIATTNLTQNLDDAFARRFLYKLEFPKPATAQRKAIWHARLSELPDDLIDRISRYNLSGGEIENVIRKYRLEMILNDRKPNLAELEEWCVMERCYHESESYKIGFMNEEVV